MKARDFEYVNIQTTEKDAIPFKFHVIGDVFQASGDGWEYSGAGSTHEFTQHKKLPSIRTIKILVKQLRSAIKQGKG